MRYVLLIGLIGLAIAFGLGLLTAPSKNPLASVDLHRPATLFLNIESGLRAFGSAAGAIVRGLVEEYTNPYRERFRRESPTQSPSR
jgi:hypothetical protein